MYTEFLSENLKGRDNSEELGVDRTINNRWILTKYGGRLWTGCIWLRIGTSEHGNEPSGSIKGGEFLD